ncbi:class I SAM-dependent methyltransferase [Pseudidiomarina insulisalsae]|nr:class I SAM-dependent methyltransferase [Pseudidiomarina insulisalsae]
MARSYTEHFETRGTAYERAMTRFPKARDEEFAQLVQAAAIVGAMRVADIPAGGGYLARHLPPDCEWLGHEPCASFTNHGNNAATSVPLLPLPWADNSIDCAVSLAGVHHLDDKRPLFAEIARVLKPGGRLVLSDVQQDSPVAKFLDEFVGAHNSTGHEGIYLNDDTPHLLTAAGFRVEQVAQQQFFWRLATREQLGDFCWQLFDLQSASPAQTVAAIDDYLGFTHFADGTVGMHWQLTTITAVTHD